MLARKKETKEDGIEFDDIKPREKLNFESIDKDDGDDDGANDR